MTSVQVVSKVELNQLIEGVAQMETPELEAFATQVRKRGEVNGNISSLALLQRHHDTFYVESPDVKANIFVRENIDRILCGVTLGQNVRYRL